MRKALTYLIPVGICLVIGMSASLFQTDSLQTWYPALNKSVLTPPNIVFPVVWTIMYILMGISAGLVYNSYYVRKNFLLGVFAAQLFFNFTWSITFFYLQNPLLGLVNILILDIIVIYYCVESYYARKSSSLVMWPYLVWIIFATYLNLFIYINN